MKKSVSLLATGLLVATSLFLASCNEQTGANAAVNSGASVTETTSVASSIAYIVVDSVAANYDYWTEQNEKVQEHAAKLERELQGRVQGLQQEAANLQQAAQNRTMTQNQYLAAEEALYAKQQNLQQYQANIQNEVLKMEAEALDDIYNKISDFLAEYGEANNLDLILTYQKGSGVWYAKEGMNITDAVIEGLNKAFEMEKNGGAPTETETDSSAAE